MELIRANYANTTTQFVVNDNTASVSNILIPDTRYQFYSANFANDSTTVTMRINFDSTQTVDRILISGHNLKSFTIYYNGATASTFAILNGNTTVSNYTSNSDTSQYFTVTPVACTSVSIDMKSTIVANQNKYVGWLVLSELLTDFGGRRPSAENYEPINNPKSVRHELSDGGNRIHSIDDKWSVNLAYDYLTQTVRDDLADIYDNKEEMIFQSLGTATGWDGFAFPCVWDGPFSFYRYSTNNSVAGFSGSLTLLET
jgi:hypothetical protein